MVTDRSRVRMLAPTRLTWVAITAALATISFTAAFLLARYPSLPFILPVHFNRVDRANGWQFKTYARVFIPVVVQLALRAHARSDRHLTDVTIAPHAPRSRR